MFANVATYHSTYFVAYLSPRSRVEGAADLPKRATKDLTDVKIPHTPKVNIKGTLMDPVLVRQWNIEGLPSDDFSVSNGIIMETSSRWPLMIDPQLQGIAWIKERESYEFHRDQVVEAKLLRTTSTH